MSRESVLIPLPRLQSTSEFTRPARHHSRAGASTRYNSIYNINKTTILISSTGSFKSGRSTRHHSRAGSWSSRLIGSLTLDGRLRDLREPKTSELADRVWYDQFTSTDWVRDSIADAYRVKALRSRKDVRGRIKAVLDGSQGWILSALVGFITATIAYAVDISEAPVFDWKDGYCSEGFFLSEKVC